MIKILPESKGSLICVKVSGKLTDAEYKNFIPYAESIIKEFGTIKFYVDMLDLDGWEWRVAWDDFAFGIKYWDNFSKLALVGERRWEKFLVLVVDKIHKADVRIVDRENSSTALTWIQE